MQSGGWLRILRAERSERFSASADEALVAYDACASSALSARVKVNNRDS
jgi:hypothetical protein